MYFKRPEIVEICDKIQSLTKTGIVRLTKTTETLPIMNLPEIPENLIPSNLFGIRDFMARFSIAPVGNFINDRGEWDSDTIYYLNDQVTHNGDLWVCISEDVEGTTEEPSDTADDWRKVVIATGGDVDIEGWGHTLGFSADNTTGAFSWTSGVIVDGAGDEYDIIADNFITVAGNTYYLYFDQSIKETTSPDTYTLQNTTTKSNALGYDKILVAVVTSEDLGGGEMRISFFDMNGDDHILDGGKLLINSITANAIAANTITASQISAGTITASEIASNTITAGQINTGSINLSTLPGNLDDIDDGTYGKVLSTSITSGRIRLSATYGDLDDIDNGTYGKVLSTDISAGHIVLSHVIGNLDDVDEGTTYGKVKTTDLSAGHIKLSETIGDLDDVDNGTYAKVLSTEISAGHILIKGADGTTTVINGGEIQTGSIKADDIAANAITTAKITIGAITSNELETNCVVRDKLGNNAVGADEIEDGVITNLKIKDSEIEAAKLGTTVIVGGYLKTDLIETGSIVADKINVANLRALSADMGSLSAGKITAGSSPYIRFGEDVYGTNHGLYLSNGDHWYSSGSFLIGGSNGISYSGSGDITIGSNVNVNGDISGANGTFTGSITGASGAFEGSIEVGGIKIGKNVTTSDHGVYLNSTNYWYDDGEFSMGGSTGIYHAGGAANIRLRSNVVLDGNLNMQSGYLKSNNYSSGSAGWKIPYTGNAEFNDVTVRGTIYASAGTFTGTITSSSITGGSINIGSGVFQVDNNGQVTATNFRTASTGSRFEMSSNAIAGYYGSTLQTTLSNSSGYLSITGKIKPGSIQVGTQLIVDTSGNITGTTFKVGANTIINSSGNVASQNGFSGSWVNQEGDTVTVVDGIITSVI